MRPEPEPPSPYDKLLLERQGDVVLITLNRPDKLNALDPVLQAELAHALGLVAEQSDVRVVILTGAGRGFCAGLDLQHFKVSLGNLSDRSPKDSPFSRLEALPQPVIAAVNGPAVTGGLELALACDMVIASRSASFADTHARVGVMPGAGLSQKLSRIIGLPRAMALSLSGDFLSAEDAYRIGLVSHLTADADLLDTAWQLAQRMCEAEAPMLRAMKRVIKEGARLPLREALQLEQDAHRAWAAQQRPNTPDDRRERVFAGNRERLGQTERSMD